MAEYNFNVSRLTNCIRDLQAIELLSVKIKYNIGSKSF